LPSGAVRLETRNPKGWLAMASTQSPPRAHQRENPSHYRTLTHLATHASLGFPRRNSDRLSGPIARRGGFHTGPALSAGRTHESELISISFTSCPVLSRREWSTVRPVRRLILLFALS